MRREGIKFVWLQSKEYAKEYAGRLIFGSVALAFRRTWLESAECPPEGGRYK
jgi:hypothetical protein